MDTVVRASEEIPGGPDCGYCFCLISSLQRYYPAGDSLALREDGRRLFRGNRTDEWVVFHVTHSKDAPGRN